MDTNIDSISHNPGTVIIKHIDPWHGTSYLKDDLTFTTHRDQASKFYLLKSNDNSDNTAITNGDRISINIGNRNLIVNGSTLTFENRNLTSVNTFLIVNGTNDTESIMFNTPLFLIIDKTTKSALKYVWDIDLNNILDTGSPSFKQNNRPILSIASYDNLPERDINTFKFSLEHNNPQINILTTSHPQTPYTSIFNDNYKGNIIIVILLIILVICALLGKY
jgi:hypothetical protein